MSDCPYKQVCEVLHKMIVPFKRKQNDNLVVRSFSIFLNIQRKMNYAKEMKKTVYAANNEQATYYLKQQQKNILEISLTAQSLGMVLLAEIR